jgi:hypothetical protein
MGLSHNGFQAPETHNHVPSTILDWTPVFTRSA